MDISGLVFSTVKPRLSEPPLSIIRNLDYPDGIPPTFSLIRTARVKIQTSSCSILLFLVLLPGAMASMSG